jgi:hypothetical protein
VVSLKEIPEESSSVLGVSNAIFMDAFGYLKAIRSVPIAFK